MMKSDDGCCARPPHEIDAQAREKESAQRRHPLAFFLFTIICICECYLRSDSIVHVCEPHRLSETHSSYAFMSESIIFVPSSGVVPERSTRQFNSETDAFPIFEKGVGNIETNSHDKYETPNTIEAVKAFQRIVWKFG